MKKAEGWKGLQAEDYLEDELKLGYRNTYDKVESRKGFILVHSSKDEKYDRISFALEKDYAKILFTLKKGEWTDKQFLSFKTDRGEKKCVFKAKLLELSPNGRNLKLYFTPFCQLDGWSQPPELAKELENIFDHCDPFPASSPVSCQSIRKWVVFGA